MKKQLNQHQVRQIAKVCHEANRAIQIAQGDLEISAPWHTATRFQQDSSMAGVNHALGGATPEKLHESWMAHHLKDGWTHGEMKDTALKTHPCLVPYDELPAEQQLKDRVFHSIVIAMAQEMGVWL